MDLEERKAFESVKKESLWFGRAFLASKGGTAWEGAKGGSGLRVAPWFDYYWGLIHGRLEECCKHLGDFRLEIYDKKMFLKEVSGVIEAVTAFDIPVSPSGTPQQKMKWERLPVTRAFVKQYRDKLDILFDKDVIYNAPWNEQSQESPDNPFVIISADNRFYRDHLMGVYTELAEKLQVIQTKQPKSTPATQTSESAPETESRRMEKEIERLRNEIDALKKQRSGRPEEDQPEEDQLGQNLVYRMTLLYRLGLLDKSLWPKDATQDQISTVLGTVLSSPQSPAKTTTVKRYLKGLVNQDYDGQKIEEKYGPRVDELLKKVFVGKDE